MNRLQALKKKMTGGMGLNMLGGAINAMLPQLGETLDKMQKPETEGGILKENEDLVAFIVVNTSKGPALTLNALRKTDEGMLITRTISNQPLEKIFEDGNTDES
jgi:hypothetical protein